MAENATAFVEPRNAPIRRRRFAGLIDGGLAAALSAAFDVPLTGAVEVGLPSGRRIRLGRARQTGAVIDIRSYRALARIARRGLVGFAESYMEAEVDTPSLPALIAFFLANEAALVAAAPRLLRSSAADRRWHKSRANTREGSRSNIAAHYDLGNTFYRLWLDEGLSYSSAIYRQTDATLDEAQAEKHRAVLEALEIEPGVRVLEIGCGWGSMVEALAGAGADVTAVTISREQLEETAARIERTGHAGRARVLFQDYRDLSGRFDRIVSIEMIEAVGEEHWPDYFAGLARHLEPGGAAVLQAITIREDLFEDYRARPDFIQRYIFPGGMLPTEQLMRANASQAGLAFEAVERFGVSYAETLVAWRHRFQAVWPEVEALGFDDRFRRMWDYYLCYCEAGFRNGLLDVGLYRLRKPVDPGSSDRRVQP